MRRLFFLIAGAVIITSVILGSFGAYRVLQRTDAPQAIPATIPFETVDGRTLSVTDFKGRYVLLNVWATWCPPCVKELPSLDRLQAENGSSTFEVVALSIDRQGREVIEPFYTRTGIKHLAIYLDRNATSMSALRITGLPTTVLLDPAGREIARWAGAREWDHPGTVSEIEGHMSRASGTRP